ncbi:hypothetical protein [Paenibacillus radicis (ex Xue et al. 2023)]|uniref:Uncharacterized protein n=1 Tax=Paenibacillus radicis (ex Xue et al. 2023) TaxID=2972489 RepID=A0ABT1YE56_9BACL|nr:hypothetical protein [Paenibacillus radicis (ex Xue et al. 2023)]MCR8631446.1 hypothetical protein [Paenibacillus radicis (ex Xue et al. 2023)]
MKRRKTQFMVGMLSAALLFNGTMALTPSVYADDDDAVVIVKAPLDSNKILTDWMRLMVVNTSGVANKDLSDILDALASGQTLSQASGLNGNLSSELFKLADQTVANAANNFAASVDELDNLSKEMKSKTLEVLSIPGYRGGSLKAFDFKAVLQSRMSSLNSAAITLSEDDNIDVQDRLQNGATLVQATRLDSAQLVKGLQQPIYQQLEQAEAEGTISSEQASTYKEEALQAIRTGIETPGGITVTVQQVQSNFDGAALLKKREKSIIQDISLFTAEYDANELNEALSSGLKLSQISGISTYELMVNLKGLWGKDIEEVYLNGLISDKEKEELLNQASIDIQAAINALN